MTDRGSHFRAGAARSLDPSRAPRDELPDARTRPRGWNATAMSPLSCPTSRCTGRPEAMSQIRTSLSEPPVAARRSSGLRSSPATPPRWPSSRLEVPALHRPDLRALIPAPAREPLLVGGERDPGDDRMAVERAHLGAGLE